ncbi:MAG: hypothetical protein H0T42_02310 [Deltaproteobacteria bacterium]|nr:hypothetical protein [Deltaproteobacteria bacterium]
MARLGELLVAGGLLTRAQCEQALHAQILWGGRLGTSLIELGSLDLDVVARTLGRQQGLPAALGHHFETADTDLQQRLSAELAERFACIPLLRIEQRVYVAAIRPLDDLGRRLVAADLACSPDDIKAALAPELRVRYQLEKVYRIARDARFMRASRTVPLPIPSFEIQDVAVVTTDIEIPVRLAERSRRSVTPPSELPRIDPDANPHAHVEQVSLGRAPTKRAYVPTLGTALDPPATSVGRVTLKRLAIGTDSVPRDPADSRTRTRATTLSDATRAIRRSIDRETIAELVVTTVARFVPTAEAVLFLIVRGDIALATAGFSHRTEDLPEIAIPLNQPGLISTAIQRNTLGRAASDDLGPIDYLLLSTLAMPDGDLAAIPISIGGDVIGVIAVATKSAIPTVVADSIITAAGSAFARLMRDASR